MNMCNMFYLCMTSCSLLPLLKLPLGLRLPLSLLMQLVFLPLLLLQTTSAAKKQSSQVVFIPVQVYVQRFGAVEVCRGAVTSVTLLYDFAWFCCYVSCLRSSKKAKSLRLTRCHYPTLQLPGDFEQLLVAGHGGADVDDLSPSRKQPSNATLKRNLQQRSLFCNTLFSWKLYHYGFHNLFQETETERDFC